MEAFETRLQKAISEKKVCNAVLIASHRDPSKTYTATFGQQTLSPTSPPQSPNAVFWIASCTKLLTSIAALQCVSRGLLSLDEPISHILPEFQNPQILTGFSDDDGVKKPILVPAKQHITLRQLLTHTSGMGYWFPSNPLLAEYRRLNPTPLPFAYDIALEYNLPLTYEPGAPGRWQYSVGLDWAGKAIERVNANIKLGDYMATHIFAPLSMHDTTFRPLQRADLMARLSARTQRTDDGGLEQMEMGSKGVAYPIIEPRDDTGGGGLYTTASDYNKVLESLLRDDGKLLDSSTLDLLFTPQLPDTPELVKTLNLTGPGRVLNGFGAAEVKINQGLGGIIAVEGVEGRVGKGMMCWDGLPSSYWWIDRERGTCGFYGSQTFPPGDRTTGEMFGAFRDAVYETAG